MDRFARFEDYIQRLVEGSFARLFAGLLHPREVAIHLIRAMEDHASTVSDGGNVAPDVYTVRLNPEDYAHLAGFQPDLLEALAGELLEMARVAGLSMLGDPQVELLADDSVPLHTITVSASHHALLVDEGTQAMEPLLRAEQDAPAVGGHLVLEEGKRTIPLDRPVVNLGRHRENHIVIDDTRVSRHHAQIRLRFGRYVLYDLGSSGGTIVNGEPIREYSLRAGDVISLAGYTLIYVEDEETSNGEEISDDTLSMPPTFPT